MRLRARACARANGGAAGWARAGPGPARARGAYLRWGRGGQLCHLRPLVYLPPESWLDARLNLVTQTALAAQQPCTMLALRRLVLLALVALPTASALFSTTLHGAPTEVIEPGTPGAATLTLQPWLTTYDQDVRGPTARGGARGRAVALAEAGCGRNTPPSRHTTNLLALPCSNAALGRAARARMRWEASGASPSPGATMRLGVERFLGCAAHASRPAPGCLQRRLARRLLLQARVGQQAVARLPRRCGAPAPAPATQPCPDAARPRTLEGGYWCWDEESCTERYQTDKFDMSSTGWKSEFAQEGIFGTDPSTNPFANVNMIFVKARRRRNHPAPPSPHAPAVLLQRQLVRRRAR